jgi:hypothetical protein
VGEKGLSEKKRKKIAYNNLLGEKNIVRSLKNTAEVVQTNRAQKGI